MRFPIGIALVVAVVALGVVLLVGQQIIQPSQPLIDGAAFEPSTITPNADGDDDVAVFRYTLTRNARISLTLQDEAGTVYAFRENEPRIADVHQVLFSGVVDGFTLPDDDISGEVLRRLLPDGTYTWRLVATADDGATAEQDGTLTIAEGDHSLPDLQNFTVSPTIFTPNQDAISDRVAISVILAKDAELDVYLEDEAGNRFAVPERQNDVMSGRAGRHAYDYEGGVDQGADPPDDGRYRVVAEAQDSVGQIVRQVSELTIQNGGKPLGQIVQQPSGADVIFVPEPWDDAYASGTPVALPDDPEDANVMAITMPVGNILVFRVTVENYSRVPLRTTGPEPGYVYDSFGARASTIGAFDSSGAWRVGIDCDNAISDYPWRWAIGTPDVLTDVTNPATGEVFHYLMPGERSVVWGAVRMTELIETSNPQVCWAGLIHEDVQVYSPRIGPREIELVPTEISAD
jgi:hypothetical protein